MHVGFHSLVTEDRSMPKAGAIATMVAGATTSVVGVATVRGDVSSAAAVVGLALVGATIAGVVTGRHARGGAIGLGAWAGLLTAWPATVLTVPAVVTRVVGSLPPSPPGGLDSVGISPILNAALARAAVETAACSFLPLLAGAVVGVLGAWMGSRAPGDADPEGVPSVPGVELVLVASLNAAATGAGIGLLVEGMHHANATPTQLAPVLALDAWPCAVTALAAGWAVPRMSFADRTPQERRIFWALLAAGPMLAVAVRAYQASVWTLASGVTGLALGALGAWVLRPAPGFTPNAITMDLHPGRTAVRGYLGITQLLAVGGPSVAYGLVAALGVVPSIEPYTKGTAIPPADLHDLVGPRGAMALQLAPPALATCTVFLLAALLGRLLPQLRHRAG